MLVKDFVAHLEHFKRLYSAGGAKSQAKAIEALVDALTLHLDRSVESYVAYISTVEPPAGRRRAPRGTDQNAVLVQAYASEIKTAYGNKDQFHSILEQLKHDRSITAKALTSIVNSATGHEGRFRNKDAAYDWLTMTFTDQLRFQRKLHPV